MAKLSDIIQRNKMQANLTRGPGGVLSENTGEELQSLASKAGLQAPPTTPVGAGMLGASPDQQKMAGTPAQKQAAFNLASTPLNQNLADVQRRAQARTQVTGQEQAAQEKSENLKALGGLGDRVNDFIGAQRTRLQQQAADQSNITIKAAESLSGVAPENLEAFRSKLEEFQQNPSNLQLLVDAGNLIGGRVITPEEVPGLYQNATQATAAAGATAMADSLRVSDLLTQPDFGYTQEELASLLGVPASDLANYSVKQLEDRVNQLAQEEFSRSAELEKQATSTNLGVAERALARQAGREASAVGTRSTEADIRNLEDQIAQGQIVQFGGRDYDVETLLKDDTITQIITDYLTNPNSPESKKLAAEEPELLALINKNQSLFQDAITTLQGQTREFGTIQEENRALANVGKVQLSDPIMKAFFEDYGSLRADRYTVDPNSSLAYMQNNPEAGEKIVSQMNDLVTKHGEYAGQLAELSAEELASLGIDKNSPKWQSFLKNVEVRDQLNSINPKDINAVLEAYLGSPDAANIVPSYLQETNARKALGIPSGDSTLLDKNRDGVVDDPNDIYLRLKAQTPEASLKDAAAGRVGTFQQGSLQQPRMDSFQKEVYNRLGHLGNDGQVTGAEIAKEFAGAKSGQDLTFLMDLRKNLQGPMNNSATKKSIEQVVQAGREANAADVLKDIKAKGLNIGNQINYIKELITGKGHYYKNRPNLEFVDIKPLTATLTKLAEEFNRQLEEAKKERDKRERRRKIQDLTDLGQMDGGDNLIAIGKVLGNDQIIKMGKKYNDNTFELTEETLKLGMKLQSGGKRLTENIRQIGGTISDANKNITGGGCFLEGTQFYLEDGSLKNVEQLTPRDTLLMGGSTYATAQFVCREMYSYGQSGILVAGSHAVLEKDGWTRVRNSPNATRRPDLDGSIVYVVWNERHRMVHADGTIFTDYAETDSTVAEIEEMRNIDVLNSGTPQ